MHTILYLLFIICYRLEVPSVAVWMQAGSVFMETPFPVFEATLRMNPAVVSLMSDARSGFPQVPSCKASGLVLELPLRLRDKSTVP